MILKIGSAGEEVKRLQARLGLKPDGSFGPVTEAKVKEWQTSNALSPSGIVGDADWSVLFPGTSPSPGPSTPAGGFMYDKLKGHIPDNVLNQIPETSLKFSITGSLRLAHFLSQCSHESGGFASVYEKLNYSAERLVAVFPKYFPNDLSRTYANNPAKIAARLYANRMGNGDEASGDGYKFRGRGYIQLTGKNNYSNFAAFIGEDTVSNPDLVATKYPLASAGFFFNANNIWPVCDQGATEAVVAAVTRRVNGGTIGLPDRVQHFNEFYSLLR